MCLKLGVVEVVVGSEVVLLVLGAAQIASELQCQILVPVEVFELAQVGGVVKRR